MPVNFSMIWLANASEKPAEVPKLMSFSSLVAMESCPLKWSLSQASYSKIWNGYRYPVNPTMASLVGQIVHGAIQKIVQIIISSGIASLDDSAFVQTMREVGGYSAIIETEIERIDKELAQNPRLISRHNDLKAGLLLRMESLRETIQLLISDLELPRVVDRHATRKPVGRNKTLMKGHYAEIDLRSAELGWYGKVDYLKVLEDGCAIFDFKTGEEKPDHEFQINIYDLLWHFDKERNANSLPVKSKALVYANRRISVQPLSGSELHTFAEMVSNRSKAAIEGISLPSANISPSNCGFCLVRQLCANYWTQEGQDLLRIEQATGDGPFTKARTDFEVRLVSSNSSRVWKAKVLVGMFIPSQTEIFNSFRRFHRKMVWIVIE